MGFMDKAKKLAEQAQHKLDEAQQNFNKSDAPQGGDQGGQRFDEHGRPVEEGPPAGQTPAPTAQPAPASPDPTAPAPAPDAPAATPDPEAPAPGSGSNASPDPFKPLDQ